MAWTTPTSRTTGNLITASIWNTDLVDNLVYLKSIADQTDGYKVVRKTASESLNTSTTLQDDNELLFAVAANDVWQFDLTLYIQAASAGSTMDFKCGWSLPTSATGYWGPVGDTSSTALQFGTGQVGATVAALQAMEGSTTQSFGLHDTGVVGIKLSGVAIIASTAGNVTFRWAQNTSNANNLSVLLNSSLILHKLT
jgi:hypothetical protein